MSRNLLISGGWAHDFVTTAPLLAACIDKTQIADLDTTIAEDLEDATRYLAAQEWDLVTVFACWFNMLDARYTDEQRIRWGRQTGLEFRELLSGSCSRGTPLFAVHTAPICFDDWPEWAELLGGAWQWGTSFHPSPEILEIHVVGNHPIVNGIDSFTVRDERYSHLAVSSAVEVQLATQAGQDDGRVEPMLWTHHAGSSRVVYSALGHDEVSLKNERHQQIIRRSVAWLMGATPEQVASA